MIKDASKTAPRREGELQTIETLVCFIFSMVSGFLGFVGLGFLVVFFVLFWVCVYLLFRVF